jgi:AcrR family transcriptional regulator
MVKASSIPKRQRTRAALVKATLAIIAERGFSAVTLSGVAARADVTTGAIYSNFSGKGELMWAAVGTKTRYIVPHSKPGDSLRTHARAIAHALMAQMPLVEEEAAFCRELAAYISTDPELRAIRAGEQARFYGAIANHLEAELGDRLAVSSRALALGIQAFIRGFAAEWAMSPVSVTEDIIAENFEALLIGATTPR